MQETYLFVYGTLMSKYPQNPLKKEIGANLAYIGEGFTYGKLFLVDYYPALIVDHFSEKTEVYGEIFKVNNPFLAFQALDKYEDFFPDNKPKSLYIRELRECFLVDSEAIFNCNVYIYNKSTDKLKNLINGRFIAN